MTGLIFLQVPDVGPGPLRLTVGPPSTAWAGPGRVAQHGNRAGRPTRRRDEPWRIASRMLATRTRRTRPRAGTAVSRRPTGIRVACARAPTAGAAGQL